jgi:ABC-type transport system involved in cytochrome c biogenesis permease subunit
MKQTSRNLSWVFVSVSGLIVLLSLLLAAVPAAEGPKEFHLRAFGELPVTDHGRVKPIDTLARVSLLILSGKQEYTDADGQAQPAVHWLLDVMTAVVKNGDERRRSPERPIPGPSADVKAYRIEGEELKKRFQLEGSTASLFSFNDLYRALGAEGMKELAEEGANIDPTSPLGVLIDQLNWHTQYSAFETTHKVFRIDHDQVIALLGLERRKGLTYGFDELLPRVSHLHREAERVDKINPKQRDPYEKKVWDVHQHVTLYVGLARGNAKTLHLIAPSFPGDKWKTLPEALRDLPGRGEEDDAAALRVHASTLSFQGMLVNYNRGEREAFNKEVADYAARLRKEMPADMDRAGSESGFNDFAPFYRCMLLYVFVFLVACVSWMWRSPVITWYAFALMALTVLLHTWALGMRMYIQKRPPVTNLYSSAVFIGWATVLISLAIELKYRNALALAVASLTGFSTLIIAHYLSGSGDTLEMMQAVLDTNFWLATHVTTVTIGYSATFVAGFFGIVFLWMMLVTHMLSSLREGRALSFWGWVVFGTCAVAACVFVILLAVGLLNGLWYGSGHRGSLRMLVRGLSGLAILGLLFAPYLLWHRIKQATGSAPPGLPPGARFLESFALTEHTRRVLVWMMYGTICFATLFSFVGTVLGGIWADYSWGRFWGWDPKENGALLIVIMNALILHARWGGMVRDRGVAVLTLVGNMVTMWSWFGTNQLGRGLHAYGFNDALVQMCRWFWVSQLALIGLALLPLRNWRDYKPTPLAEATLPPPAPPVTHRAKGKRGSTRIQPR